MVNNSRKWSIVNYILLWIGVCFSIPTFMVTETLWNYGLNAIEIIIITILASLLMGSIIAILSLITYKQKLTFTSLVEYCFGKKFSKIVVFFRILVCSGWFGINICLCCETIINTFFKEYNKIVVYVLLFVCLSILNFFLSINDETIKTCENVSSSILLLFFIIMFIILSFLSKRSILEFDLINTTDTQKNISSSFMLIFIYWSGFASNMPDFIVKGKTLKSALYGNVLGITIGMFLVVSISLFFCNTSHSIGQGYLWNPIDSICCIFNYELVNVISCMMMVIFMFTTNIASNSYPAIKCIKRVFGCTKKNAIFILMLFSCLLCPWFLISSVSSFSMYWINTYSIFSLPLISVFISTRTSKHMLSEKEISILYILVCVLLLLIHLFLPKFDNISLIIGTLLPLLIGTLKYYAENDKNNRLVRH